MEGSKLYQGNNSMFIFKDIIQSFISKFHGMGIVKGKGV